MCDLNEFATGTNEIWPDEKKKTMKIAMFAKKCSLVRKGLKSGSSTKIKSIVHGPNR